MCWVGSKTVRRTPTPSASSRNSIGSSNHGSTTMSARHEPPDSSRELGTLEIEVRHIFDQSIRPAFTGHPRLLARHEFQCSVGAEVQCCVGPTLVVNPAIEGAER